MTNARFPGAASVAYAVTPVSTVTVTVGAGGAAQGATSVPVTALTGAIPSGAKLTFTGGKVATLTAAAAASATSLTVAALAQALVASDVATYDGYTKISEVTSSGYPESTNARSDVTNFDSPNLQEEFIVGFTANGDLVIEANWTGAAEQAALFGYFDSRAMLSWKITVPNLHTGDTSGFVTTFTGQLARCTHNAITPRDPVKLLLTVVCNSPSRTAAPAVP